METFINKTIAKRYRCVREIGSGGMGVVYLAEDNVLNREVALKVLRPAFKDDKNTPRFFREAKILSQLNHPHIVTIHDFGMWRGRMYIVLEYLAGSNLHQILEKSGTLPAAWLMNVLPQIMEALEAAHLEGIVHRDLKPSNIFCLKQADGSDYIKILDFGTAVSIDQDILDQITPTGEMIGSPSYMAPEQITGRGSGPRSDIYALGVTMYEVLSGKPPFRGESMMSTFLCHLYQPPKPINLREGEDEPRVQHLLEIINTCLNKNPEDRYGSIRELRKTFNETPKPNVRLPENLVGDREVRFKQYYMGPIGDISTDSTDSTDTRISGITPALNTPLLAIEAENLPIQSTIVPLLKITNHFVQSPVSLDWDKMKTMMPPAAIILNKGKEENLQLIREIQHKESWKNIPVLICGPEGDLDYISRVIDAGAADYLSYPFDPKDIIKKIESLTR